MAFLQAKINWSTTGLSAGIVKSVAGFKAPANQVVKVLEVRASHDGNTSGNAPDVTDLYRCTYATNAPGTNSTAYTPVKKDPGRAETIQTAAGINWTAEPTVITVQESLNLAQYNGLYHYIFPFAAPEIVVGGQGYGLRHNSPNSVQSTGKFDIEE